MAKSRKRRPVAATGPREGTYTISTGTAELISDDYTPDGWVLEINGMESSHIVVGRPRELDFEYMRWLAAIVEVHVSGCLDESTLRITHLGGGACSLARYFADLYPGSRNTVVELDAKLAAYVRQWFDLPRAPSLKIRVGEARAVTETFAPASRDIIIRDVFSGHTTPLPLTTLEFTKIAAGALSSGGLYVINCGDNRDLAGARAEAAALAAVFPYTCAAADPAMLKGRRRGNIILAGSPVPLPRSGENATAQLAKRLLAGAVPAQYRDDSWVRAFARSASPRRDRVPGPDLGRLDRQLRH